MAQNPQKPTGAAGPVAVVDGLDKNLSGLISASKEAKTALKSADNLSKTDAQSVFDKVKGMQNSVTNLNKSLKALRTEAASILVESRKRSPKVTDLSPGSVYTFKGEKRRVLEDGSFETIEGGNDEFSPVTPQQQ